MQAKFLTVSGGKKWSIGASFDDAKRLYRHGRVPDRMQHARLKEVRMQAE